MFKSIKVIASVSLLAWVAVSCTQQPKTKKQADLQAVKEVHKSVIANAIAKDLDTLKFLPVAKTNDENLLNLLKKQNRIAISLGIFVLKSAPDASMQEFGLGYIQSVRSYTSQLKAISVTAGKPVETTLFDEQKLNAVQRLENISSMDDVQKDFVQYASTNALIEKTIIENYRNKVENPQLINLAKSILATDEAFVKRLDDFKSVWKIAK